MVAVVVAVAAVVVAVAADVGDREHTEMKNIKHILNIAILAGTLATMPLAQAQSTYPTPEAAAEALVDGIARHDGDAIKVAVGPDYRKYIPTSTVDPEDVTNFLEAWARAHAIVKVGADRAFLGAGVHGWTLAIPIVKTAAGWKFDTKAAPEELRIRRIGRNELAVIQVAMAYADAQDEYQQRDWNGDGVREYAMRALSSPGKRDGLYWASLPGEPESPLGVEFADARAGQAYHGYHYKILTAQGKNAPGGARSYVKNGHLTEGYALVAWPARWGDTGVMTFIVSRDGVVYQKDLGPGSATVAKAMTSFNPGAGWEKVASR